MKDRPASETPDSGRRSSDTCKFVGKALTPGLRARGIDVEALLAALEARTTARRVPEATVPRVHDGTDGEVLADVLEFTAAAIKRV